jgi:anti-anti-sigma factor
MHHASGRGEDAPEHAAIEGALAVVRELLEMDVAYVTRFDEHTQEIERIDGDGRPFGLEPGTEVELEQSYCARMISGSIPKVIPDTAAEPGVADLDVTKSGAFGAYVGVPLRLASGRLYGTFCCLSREPNADLAGRDLRYLESIAQLVADHIERAELERQTHLLELQASSFGALLAALEARDSYTGDHSEQVVRLAGRVALELGLEPGAVVEVEQVALIHDIGKLGTPDAILRKQGPLTASEWEVMRQHPVTGEQIVAAVPNLAHLAPAVRAEHERWDGTGYPDGLAGEAIPLASRIVLACDAWHAMRSDRPYRQAMSEANAYRELREGRGVQFAPDVVDALLSVIATEPPGKPSSALEPSLSIEVSRVPGRSAVVLSVRGDVDIVGAGLLKRRIDGALTARPQAVVVEASRATYVDSSALTVLMNAADRCRERAVRLAVAAPSSMFKVLLDAASLRGRLASFRTVAEALDAASCGLAP